MTPCIRGRMPPARFVRHDKRRDSAQPDRDRVRTLEEPAPRRHPVYDRYPIASSPRSRAPQRSRSGSEPNGAEPRHRIEMNLDFVMVSSLETFTFR